MLKGLEQSLQNLTSSTVRVTANDAYPAENGYASIFIVFKDGTRLRAEYWRITKGGQAYVSSFDHKQKYGLPAPVDAIEMLKKELEGQSVLQAGHDKETGDLLFSFTNEIKLQVLNVTGYEIWEISFPDGTREYSNYAK